MSKSLLSEMLIHDREDHLTPVQSASIAAAAGVKELALTHVVPGMDGETDVSGYTKGIALIFKGKVTLAHDLQRF